jgi:hypothetical protein
VRVLPVLAVALIVAEAVALVGFLTNGMWVFAGVTAFVWLATIVGMAGIRWRRDDPRPGYIERERHYF